MKKSFFLIFFIHIVSCVVATNQNLEDKFPVDYVNPYIGNISHLLVPTYPTVHLPNSMLRIYPVREDYSSNYISALPLIVPDHRKGSVINIIPSRGTIPSDLNQIKLSYDNEVIKPYLYDTYLDEIGVNVKFVPSHQSALYIFQLDRTSEQFSLSFPINTGKIFINGNSIYGYEYLVDGESKVYFYAESSVNITDSLCNENAKTILFPLDTSSIQIKYGVSFISLDQAKNNLYREIKDLNFEQLIKKARDIWNKELGKIEVKTITDIDDLRVFYTALYRTFERPILISEDGCYYSAFDKKVHPDGGKGFYVDDWYWDTFRATHPLRILIDNHKESDILNSIISMPDYMREGEKWLPQFPKITGDSHGMNCNHGIISICDALYKGVEGINIEKAFEVSEAAVINKTLIPWSGAKAGELDKFYYQHGYFPALKPNEVEYVKDVTSNEHRQAVAVTLGTSYDHWALSRIAKLLCRKDKEDFYKSHSFNYRNLFNKETLFFHPKDSAGLFIPDVDYRFDRGRGARHYYDENNAYTYRWDVQHNIVDLIDLMGGDESFVKELDALFTTSLGMGKFNFYRIFGGDQTGNVGQFSMGNEPSFHIPYLYNYVGYPWKTQKMIKKLLNMWFRNDLMGVPGDEDGGGMSAFVVFSQLGFYPITPGLPIYTIGTPSFSYAKIMLSNGNFLEIKAKNISDSNKYIQSVKINGEKWNIAWFTHEHIKNGGIIEFEMGNKPNYNWGNTPFKDTNYYRDELY